MTLHSVRLRNVRRSYPADAAGQLEVLDIDELELRASELTCILGATGCGKTTLLNILSGVDTSHQGQIDSEPTSVPQVAYMFQSDLLLPWRTVERNISVGLEAAGEKSNHDVINDWLRTVGLDRFAKVFPNSLSMGMRQRVALARTLILEADLILLDEPLSHQDFSSRLEMEGLLRTKLRGTGRIGVVVTHNIEEAVALGDRVVVLAGRPAGIVADIAIHGLPEVNRPIGARRTPHFANHVQRVAQALTLNGGGDG